MGLDRDSIVHSKKALRDKMRVILREFHQPVLVQSFLPGREFNVGIVGGRRLRVMPLAEVDYSQLPAEIPPIMSYAAKYIETAEEYKKTSVICPATVEPDLAREIISTALAGVPRRGGVGLWAGRHPPGQRGPALRAGSQLQRLPRRRLRAVPPGRPGRHPLPQVAANDRQGGVGRPALRRRYPDALSRGKPALRPRPTLAIRPVHVLCRRQESAGGDVSPGRRIAVLRRAVDDDLRPQRAADGLHVGGETEARTLVARETFFRHVCEMLGSRAVTTGFRDRRHVWSSPDLLLRDRPQQVAAMAKLLESLRDSFAADVVITHNQRGEYGHCYHRVVHRICCQVFDREPSCISSVRACRPTASDRIVVRLRREQEKAVDGLLSRRSIPHGLPNGSSADRRPTSRKPTSPRRIIGRGGAAEADRHRRRVDPRFHAFLGPQAPLQGGLVLTCG